MKRLTGAVVVVLAVLAAVLAFNAVRFSSRQIDVPRNAEAAPDVASMAQRLAQAVRFQTVSSQDASKFPRGAFEDFQAFLARSFPRMQSSMRLERVNHYSLLYEWTGTDSTLKPVLVMAHQDVVPVDPVSAGEWRQPPFGGIVADGFVWGRGTLDDKGAVMGLHEAAEALLAQSRLKREGYFHPESVRRVWQAHLSGRVDQRSLLWNVLMFQSWLDGVASPQAARMAALRTA